MSGGGAHGAYEAGVLSYVFGDLAKRLGKPIHFDIVTGASVGGVHACYLAGCQDEPAAGARLVEIWESLSLERVFRVGVGDLFRIPWKLLGFGAEVEFVTTAESARRERLPSLFEASWLEDLVAENINWKAIRANLDHGVLHALAIAATEIATGRSVVFLDAQAQVKPWAGDPFVIARPARIGPAHALASAAIPLIFPGVRIDRAFYCDGGLRLNTPLSPALRLGAERLLIIGLRHIHTPEEEDRSARRREAQFASPTYLAGKALNALLLDRVDYDIQHLRTLNTLLAAAAAKYGEDFLNHINHAIRKENHQPYRIVRHAYMRPSEDLGALASECLRHQTRGLGMRDWLSRNIARFAARGAMGEADLLSYLYFDRCYARHLISLGRRDAAAAEDQLASLFTDR